MSTRKYTRTRTPTPTPTCIHTQARERTHTHTHIYVCVFVCGCVCVWVRVCVCAYPFYSGAILTTVNTISNFWVGPLSWSFVFHLAGKACQELTQQLIGSICKLLMLEKLLKTDKISNYFLIPSFFSKFKIELDSLLHASLARLRAVALTSLF